MEISKEEKEAIEKFREYIDYCENNKECREGLKQCFGCTIEVEEINAAKIVLNLIEKLQKENDELKNHIHYKKCLACGNEFKAKRKDAKYCTYCSRFMTNRIWYMNLSEEQKAKRREQAKISMRKLRAK